MQHHERDKKLGTASKKAEHWKTEVVNMHEKFGTEHMECEIQVLKPFAP